MEPPRDPVSWAVMSTPTFSRIKLCGTVVFYAIGALLYLILVLGLCSERHASGVGLWAVFMWVSAHFFPRLLPLVLSQPGRLTHVRVREADHRLLPTTTKGFLSGYVLLLADGVLLPLSVGLSMTYPPHRWLAELLSMLLYPPALSNSVLFYLLFWSVPVVGAAVHLIHSHRVWRERVDPYSIFERSVYHSITSLATVAAAWCLVPTFSFLCSAFPCTPSLDSFPPLYFLQFSPSTHCMSLAHRFHMLVALPFFFLLLAVTDLSLAALYHLEEPHAPLRAKRARSDPFFIETMRLLRLLTVVLLTIRPSTFNCCVVGFGSALLLCWLLLGNFASNVQCLQDGYKLVLGMLALLSFFAAAAESAHDSMPWLKSVWWAIWAFCSAAVCCLQFRAYQYGFTTES